MRSFKKWWKSIGSLALECSIEYTSALKGYKAGMERAAVIAEEFQDDNGYLRHIEVSDAIRKEIPDVGQS